ncbi:hypothetical protein DRO42_06880 [Candidatus Bathyarchaeota archaeon]|nr:MAG: hypothetical protein DRO42_06880 [Candidatus Bathyarchaeota archaeon]
MGSIAETSARSVSTISPFIQQYLAPRKATDIESPREDRASGLKGFVSPIGNLKTAARHRYVGGHGMGTRRATVIRVDDAATFIIRPNMAVKLAGVEPPERGTPEAERARERLESLVLRKKVEFETLEWDRLGRSIALVRVDDVDVNEAMKEYLKTI